MNILKQFFTPYKSFKIKKYNWWFNAYQGNIYAKNFFILSWQWICDDWHKDVRFSFSLFRFSFRYISRALISIHFYTWDKSPAMFLSIEAFYLPALNFRIGNGKTWFWIRNENWWFYRCNQRNKKQRFEDLF